MEDFKQYRLKTIVKAKPFTDDMADGFDTRYGTPNEDGSYSTYGFSYGYPDEEEIKVPYVMCPVRDRKLLAGEGYTLLILDDGCYKVMRTEDFQIIYEEL
jgi:hypothetical protein